MDYDKILYRNIFWFTATEDGEDGEPRKGSRLCVKVIVTNERNGCAVFKDCIGEVTLLKFFFGAWKRDEAIEYGVDMGRKIKKEYADEEEAELREVERMIHEDATEAASVEAHRRGAARPLE